MGRMPVDLNRRAVLKIVGAVLVGTPVPKETIAAFERAQTPAPSTRPDFTGVWTHVPGSAAVMRAVPGLIVGQSWGRLPTPVTLSQDAASLVITYISNARSHQRVQLTYRLDGTETMNSNGASAAPQDRPSRAVWEGSTLVLLSRVDLPDRASGGTTRHEFRDVLALESPDVLRVQTSHTARGATAAVVSRLQRIGPPTGRGPAPAGRGVTSAP
jgi:hypothetical protein